MSLKALSMLDLQPEIRARDLSVDIDDLRKYSISPGRVFLIHDQ